MVGLFLALSLNVCSEEKPKDKAKDKSDNKATIVGEVLDPYGEPVSDVTIVMAASMMTMRHKPLYSGEIPFEVFVPKSEKWSAAILNYAYDTVWTFSDSSGPGSYPIHWDETDNDGNHCAEGVYRVFASSSAFDGELGVWAIWNESDESQVLPLLEVPVSDGKFLIDNYPIGPDTLNIFYQFTLHYTAVNNPFYFYCIRDGQNVGTESVELQPGENKVRIITKE